MTDLPGLKRLNDCPTCGSTVYAPTEWHGILPPPRVGCSHLTAPTLEEVLK